MTDQNNRPRGDWESPAYVSFITPFCIVRPDNEEDFTVPLDDINQNTYDHGLLCRVVTALPSPLLNTTSLLICADGAIAVPAIPELESINDVLDVINDALCCLLLGGHLCEAIDTRDVVSGNLHECRAIWPTNLGKTMGSVQEFMIYWLDQSSVSSRRWVRFRFDSTSDCKKNYEFLD